jgi:hypothetical protein
MPHRHLAHRPPRAHLDPVACAADALSLFELAMHQPMQPELIALLLDAEGRGDTIVVVTDATDPDAVVDVAETMSLAAAGNPSLCRLVLATVRPCGATQPGDVDRWLEASAVSEAHGVELVEWFVFGPAGAECPRDLLGERERW